MESLQSCFGIEEVENAWAGVYPNTLTAINTRAEGIGVITNPLTILFREVWLTGTQSIEEPIDRKKKANSLQRETYSGKYHYEGHLSGVTGQ